MKKFTVAVFMCLIYTSAQAEVFVEKFCKSVAEGSAGIMVLYHQGTTWKEIEDMLGHHEKSKSSYERGVNNLVRGIERDAYFKWRNLPFLEVKKRAYLRCLEGAHVL